ncbi:MULTISPECIES: aminodeoxychorismate synthase component I [unclassified Oceanobacillus]|uniref:aminodeoxychorismate synthase component I n=1 Tax=unclassified Oceanobacillus TaxID=2630292 RepID=UPI001BE5617D|nr:MULTISPECIES: aminodeoxychorismate synthase component I [unclassified Oceanobacillus]MBT2600614.1 aminodeoxychorismate synthase component I [Oceanobacillus sp. ISL-74]MBT2650989.1 aminodeoxychorismate synthase component I [Oceanobacillus sp. ISL-73]
MQQTGKLIFDFAFDEQKKKRLVFLDPVDMIVANAKSEVISAMEKIETYTNQGYYAGGYISYEAGEGFDNNLKTSDDFELPLIMMGIYKQPLEKSIDEQECPQTSELFEWEMSTSKKKYLKHVSTIKNSIAQGDTYQVNYTVRLHSNDVVCDHNLYEKLSKAQKANYCAHLQLGRYNIVSASPELFFQLKNGKILTKPMKGTMKRGKSIEEDIRNKQLLSESIKDQAENLMIVDLLRNDISKIAKKGTVNVPKLFNIESYPTVFQMTSTVSAEIEENVGIIDIFKALFPCGSITGAPKQSTMQIIQGLENSPREVYCGSIGYITPNQEALFNVAIRTALIDTEQNTMSYGVGGGITWDSDPEAEYLEAWAKAEILKSLNETNIELLETMKYENGHFFLINNHLNRLNKSAEYFNFSISIKEIEQKLYEYAEENLNQKQAYRVRLLANKRGEIKINSTIIPVINEKTNYSFQLAASPINKKNPYYYHKTTFRKMYEKFREELGNAFDILLWNDKEELTEFTMGNLVVKVEGEYWTPPIKSGLLAGTFRQQLIDEKKIKERIISKSELESVDEIWFINSVRGWMQMFQQ